MSRPLLAILRDAMKWCPTCNGVGMVSRDYNEGPPGSEDYIEPPPPTECTNELCAEMRAAMKEAAS